MVEPKPYSQITTQSTLIEGVKTKSLRVIPDERGWLMEILRSDEHDLFSPPIPGLSKPGITTKNRWTTLRV